MWHLEQSFSPKGTNWFKMPYLVSYGRLLFIILKLLRQSKHRGALTIDCKLTIWLALLGSLSLQN